MTKMKLIMDKFPFLKHTKEKIALKQKVVDCNNRIKSELPSRIEKCKDKLEKAKLEKELILLDLEQGKYYKQINEDETFFKNFRDTMQSGIEKANREYDNVVENARKKIMVDEKIAQKFKEFERFDFETNWEAKISFFLELELLLKK